MKNLTPEIAAVLCGGSCGLLPAGEITAVTTDSRAVVPGCLFGAIKGEKTDGHRYLEAAREGGACCALVEHPVPESPLPQIVVPSTEAALRQLAAFYRAQFSLPVVGVTGSVGKTTAKEMIASVLSQRWNTLKTEKNFNNELGVPFTLFRLREEHRAAVVEMGVSGFGEMTRLTQMVRPDVAVFTLIGDAHIEFLESREGILRAKAEILRGMKPDAPVIANGDDPLLSAYDFGRPTVLFGLGENCGVRAENVRAETDCSYCDILSGPRRIPLRIPSFGRHMIYAALMAAAVGLHFGLSDEEIARGIEGFENVGHRNRVVETGYLTLIDDCYNSNPTSAASAVASMGVFPQRRVCILGDMLELGPETERLHRELGAYAAREAALVVGCGELARHIAEGAGERGLWFAAVPELLERLPSLIQRGDAVLVKASRRMKFEEISSFLETLR